MPIQRKSAAPTAERKSAPNEVDAFMIALKHPLKAEIEALRVIILGADRRIAESVKWNAPSFYIEEHFATLKLHPTETLQVVLHTGAKARSRRSVMKIKDPTGLLKWAADDRCLVTFTSTEDIQAKQTALVTILRQWIKQL